MLSRLVRQSSCSWTCLLLQLSGCSCKHTFQAPESWNNPPCFFRAGRQVLWLKGFLFKKEHSCARYYFFPPLQEEVSPIFSLHLSFPAPTSQAHFWQNSLEGFFWAWWYLRLFPNGRNSQFPCLQNGHSKTPKSEFIVSCIFWVTFHNGSVWYIYFTYHVWINSS